MFHIFLDLMMILNHEVIATVFGFVWECDLRIIQVVYHHDHWRLYLKKIPVSHGDGSKSPQSLLVTLW